MMNPLDPNLHEKLNRLRNLEQIEARLARQERKTRITLILVGLLAASAFAIWFGHLLDAAWLH
jgi:hypothetical protein